MKIFHLSFTSLLYLLGVGLAVNCPSMVFSAQVFENAVISNQANQTIDVVKFSDATLTVGGVTNASAIATSGLSVRFNSLSPFICTVSVGNKIKAVATGTCLVVARQSGNANYKPAPQVISSITVTKGNQAIGTINFSPALLEIAGTTTLNAITTSKLPVSFRSTTPNTCAVLGRTATPVATGICSVMATQDGNANYQAATPKNKSIAIGKSNQTIDGIIFTPSTLTVDGTTTASATTTSNLSVTFNSTTPSICTVSGSVVSSIASGTCTIAANQPGDSNWNPALPAVQNITVAGSAIVTIQPGPSDGIDTWITSVYYGGGSLGVSYNDLIRVGGWGDSYYGLIMFNLDDAPSSVEKAEIQLYARNNDGDAHTSMSLDLVTSPWVEDSVTFNTAPSYSYVSTIPAPVTGSWYVVDITNIYRNWKNGAIANYGIQLRPDETWNYWNTFYSSDYADDPTLRPKLVLTIGH